MAVVEEQQPYTSPADDKKRKRKRKANRPNKVDAEKELGEEDLKEEEDGEKKAEKKVKCGSGIMSTESFDSLGLSEPTLKAIQEMGFQYLTQVCLDNSVLFSNFFSLE